MDRKKIEVLGGEWGGTVGCISATFLTINPTCTGFELNLPLSSEMSATDPVRRGTAAEPM
jgi:hypothetical protein